MGKAEVISLKTPKSSPTHSFPPSPHYVDFSPSPAFEAQYSPSSNKNSPSSNKIPHKSNAADKYHSLLTQRQRTIFDAWLQILTFLNKLKFFQIFIICTSAKLVPLRSVFQELLNNLKYRPAQLSTPPPLSCLAIREGFSPLCFLNYIIKLQCYNGCIFAFFSL